MAQCLATFYKDLLILWRDRAGLTILFLMPLALVIIVSLVQNNVMQLTGGATSKMVLVDLDNGTVGQRLREQLQQREELELIIAVDPGSARRDVAAGLYQCGIIIPAQTSELMEERLQQQVQAAAQGRSIVAEELPVEILFDPTLQGVVRFALTSVVNYALLGLEVMEKERISLALLAPQLAQNSSMQGTELPRTLLQVVETRELEEAQLRPNAVQQNVPAWSLFGMFFIAVPLAGALLRERHEGTLKRLIASPTPYWLILTGKTLAYALICLFQFLLMILVGRYLLPHLGTPVFTIGDQPFAVLMMALAAALAATGFGMLLGVLVRSYDQASMTGAVTIVIAAALGGVMVPVYAMPQSMQLISQISPLNWGLSGFYTLFVRGGSLVDILPNLAALLVFFAVTQTLAVVIFIRRSRS